MIVLERNNGVTDLIVWSEPPTIYMDNWALNTFATNTLLRQQFLDLFQDRGTLLISVMLAVEIGANAAPERPELRAFLDAIGPHWIPLTVDPFAVIAAQEGGRDEQGACISSAFVNDQNFSAKLRAGNLSLASVVDITRGADGVELKAATDAGTTQMVRDITRHRIEYGRDPAYLDRMWPALPWDAARYMRPIYNAFQRLTVRGAFAFDHNHARDMFHSIASAGCAQMTLLDGHWAEQTRQVHRQLGSPAGFVCVYSPADLPQFLSDLADHPRSRGDTSASRS